MSLSTLRIRDFRNIAAAELEFSERFNVIIGQNGAGKTSFLEAIDCLSRGRSFRTRLGRNLIRKGSHSFLLAARIREKGGGERRLGMEKSREGTDLRVQGRTVRTLGEFAHFLPVQVLHPEGYLLVAGGGEERRGFVDWGVFHVKHEFGDVWQRTQRLLRQRNKALRTRENRTTIRAWDQELASAASAVDRYRADYLSDLLPHLRQYAAALVGPDRVAYEYRRGWTGDLLSQLAARLTLDRERGYTSIGPQRADLVIRLDGQRAADHASRGQLKLIVSSMRLAQMSCLRVATGAPGILLIDDLSAELDRSNRQRLLELVAALQAQAFVTATDAALWPESTAQDARRFHVKQGELRAVV